MSRRIRRRCPGCFLHPSRCLCGEIPRVETRLDFLLVRHAREAFKSSNTGRLAAAAVPSCTLVDVAEFDHPFDPACLPEQACLLFPPERDHLGQETGRHTILYPEDGPPPGPLVLLDGTWGQARRMSHRLPGLDDLPRLQLTPGPHLPHRLRKPHMPGAMATLETVARAVELFDSPERARPLYDLYLEFARRMRTRRQEAPEAP